MGVINSPEFWDRHWSGTEDRYNRHHKEIWEVLKASCDFADGLWVDMGVGPATFWEKSSGAFVGVDFSFTALQKAVTRAPNGIFVKADARSTPFPNGQFDGVLLSGVLDYFDDWGPLLNEARRIGKPGCPIIFTLVHGFEGHDWSSAKLVSGKLGADPSLFEEVGVWRICEV